MSILLKYFNGYLIFLLNLLLLVYLYCMLVFEFLNNVSRFIQFSLFYYILITPYAIEKVSSRNMLRRLT